MRTVDIHDARTQLSRLVELAARGKGLIISKSGKPLVEVTPLDAPTEKETRRLGFMEGQGSIPADFDRLGEDDALRLFNGGG